MTYRTTRANARLPPKRGIWTTERRQSGVTVGGMSSPSRHAEARRLMFEKVRKPSGSLARRLTAKRKNAFPGAPLRDLLGALRWGARLLGWSTQPVAGTSPLTHPLYSWTWGRGD